VSAIQFDMGVAWIKRWLTTPGIWDFEFEEARSHRDRNTGLDFSTTSQTGPTPTGFVWIHQLAQLKTEISLKSPHDSCELRQNEDD
jgi:hypothetical protein